MKTSGNTVLITGGTSGIGLALAQKFAAEGNQVIVTGRNETRLAVVRHALGVQTERADMTNLADLQSLAEKYPQVNVLVNNAGIQLNYGLADQKIALNQIEQEIDTNLVGPLNLIKLFLPQLLTKEAAAIVNVTTGLAIVPKQTAPVYCGSKAGLHIATKALRWQLENSPIKVFEVISALVDTPMTEGRGSGKISPETLVEEFWLNFKRNKYEIRIGKTKFLFLLNRLAPKRAEKIMRAGL